jgi:ubiquinone/menaquinone biosynthesis C-methylase UbiE
MNRADVTRQRAKDEFEAWAASYDRSLLQHFLFQPSYRVLLEEVVQWHSERPGPFDILDIGCGTGSFLASVAGSTLPARRLVGLDYSMEMCQQGMAKSRAADCDDRFHFTHADSEFLPFESGTFDVVTCANSFHHYPHQPVVVAEMFRVLRPGGRVMLIDGFRDNVIGWVVFDIVITAIEKTVFHAPWTTMRQYFEDAGFVEVDQRKFNILFAAFVTSGTRVA